VQTVGVFAEPTADFSFNPNSPIKLTDEIIFSDLSSGFPVKWWWNFGDKDTSVLRNPKHRYQDMGTYSVTLVISNQNGCLDTISKPLEIQQFAFYIPNAFTPGTNGINDFFFGKGVGIVEYEMQIYDRWGNLTFFCKINDLPQTLPCMWNGKVETGRSNEIVQEDIFVWKVKLLDIYGETHKYIGTVTVVK
jgi:PKD domain/CHU_C Type IX secretion signal domain